MQTSPPLVKYSYNFEGFPEIVLSDYSLVSELIFKQGQKVDQRIITACLTWVTEERLNIANGEQTSVVI